MVNLSIAVFRSVYGDNSSDGLLLVFVPIFIFLDARAAQVICCVIKNHLFRKRLVVHAFHLGRYLPLRLNVY